MLIILSYILFKVGFSASAISIHPELPEKIIELSKQHIFVHRNQVLPRTVVDPTCSSLSASPCMYLYDVSTALSENTIETDSNLSSSSPLDSNWLSESLSWITNQAGFMTEIWKQRLDERTPTSNLHVFKNFSQRKSHILLNKFKRMFKNNLIEQLFKVWSENSFINTSKKKYSNDQNYLFDYIESCIQRNASTRVHVDNYIRFPINEPPEKNQENPQNNSLYRINFSAKFLKYLSQLPSFYGQAYHITFPENYRIVNNYVFLPQNSSTITFSKPVILSELTFKAFNRTSKLQLTAYTVDATQDKKSKSISKKKAWDSTVTIEKSQYLSLSEIYRYHLFIPVDEIEIITDTPDISIQMIEYMVDLSPERETSYGVLLIGNNLKSHNIQKALEPIKVLQARIENNELVSINNIFEADRIFYNAYIHEMLLNIEDNFQNKWKERLTDLSYAKLLVSYISTNGVVLQPKFRYPTDQMTYAIYKFIPTGPTLYSLSDLKKLGYELSFQVDLSTTVAEQILYSIDLSKMDSSSSEFLSLIFLHQKFSELLKQSNETNINSTFKKLLENIKNSSDMNINSLLTENNENAE